MQSSTFAAKAFHTAGISTVATTIATAVCGGFETGNPLAPINAISHIVWGDGAARQENASWQYTAVGLALNTAAISSWAATHELFRETIADDNDTVGAIVAGVLVSACAYVTDYHAVPRRLTPGFEKRLSGKSLFAIYTVLAASLAIGSLSRPNVSE